jgi:calcineurin-like phosphoesterase family protein
MGDIMDRGPDAKKILDLIMTLEKEAEEAGGRVHMLIGNHEELNITGIVFRYEDFMTPEQFVSFLPEEYVMGKEKKLKEKSRDQADLREFWKNVIRTDEATQERYKNSFNERYGRWIAEHNAVVKINDTVFVHGGLNESYSARKLETINSLLSGELHKAILEQPLRRGIVFDANGPLWYRALARKDARLLEEEFEKTLANLGAKYIVIAHSPISSEVAPEFMNRFEKRLWMIDTRISNYMLAGGRLSALIIENGNFSVWGSNHEKNHSWNLCFNPVPFLWDWQPNF